MPVSSTTISSSNSPNIVDNLVLKPIHANHQNHKQTQNQNQLENGTDNNDDQKDVLETVSVASTIVIPNPSTYLPPLRRTPHPKPSLSLVSSSLDQLRVIYVENNHNNGHNLPGNLSLLSIYEDQAANEDENDMNVNHLVSSKDRDRRPSIAATKQVQRAWEVEMQRVRDDEFETEWVKRWLTRWISFASEWLEEVISEEENFGDYDYDNLKSDNDNETGDESANEEPVDQIVKQMASEERRTIEQLLDQASTILSACSGTHTSGPLNRTFQFTCPSNISNEQVVVQLRDDSLQDHESVGVQTWGSSVYMSADICARPNYYGLNLPNDDNNNRKHPGPRSRPPKVLEIGSGTGLVGLTTTLLLNKMYSGAIKNLRNNNNNNAKIEKPEVILTDFHPLVLDNLKRNVICNLEQGQHDPNIINVGLRKLDWQIYYDKQSNPWTDFNNKKEDDDDDDDDDEQEEIFDLILGADIVYASEHAEWIAATVRAHLRRPASESEIGTPNEPAFHLIFPLRPTHMAEFESIRKAFDPKNLNIDKEKVNQNNKNPTDIWNVVIVHEQSFDRQKTVGRADEMNYTFWKIAWRKVLI